MITRTFIMQICCDRLDWTNTHQQKYKLNIHSRKRLTKTAEYQYTPRASVPYFGIDTNVNTWWCNRDNEKILHSKAFERTIRVSQVIYNIR